MWVVWYKGLLKGFFANRSEAEYFVNSTYLTSSMSYRISDAPMPVFMTDEKGDIVFDSDDGFMLGDNYG